MNNPILIISTFSETIPLAGGILSRRYLTIELKVFLAYILIGQISDLILAYLGLKHERNLWLIHGFVLIEYGVFVWLFASWQESLALKRILLLSIPLFIVASTIASLLLEPTDHFNAFARSSSNLVLTILAGYTLLKLSARAPESMFRLPHFWISSAAVLYFASSLALASLSNLIVRWPPDQARQLFNVHAGLNIIANLGFSVGLLCPLLHRKSGAQSYS